MAVIYMPNRPKVHLRFVMKKRKLGYVASVAASACKYTYDAV